MQKIKQFLNVTFWWLVLSSKDARKYSLTFKAMLASILPVLLLVGVDASQLPEGVDMVVSVIENLGVFLSSVVALYGFFRKMKLTLGGQNDVLNNSI